MSKPIYYRTHSYDKKTGENPPGGYVIKSGLSPLPSTGTFGSMTGRTSAAASCKEALQKVETIQKRDRDKGFPQTFLHSKLYPPGNHCYADQSNTKIEIEIPVKYVPEANTAMSPEANTPMSPEAMTPYTNSMGGYTRRHRQRRVSTRRRRASRRKVKRTRHSTKRRR